MILILLPLAFSLAQIPASPMWPSAFWQNFTETIHSHGDHETSGSYYYDWTVQSLRIDRANGRYDSFCGILGPYASDDTPCSQYVNNGNRYIHYPEKNHCCFCCNAAHGCGMLPTDWMTKATYIDTEIHNGVLTYKWNKKGVQNYFIYETVGPVPVDRVTVSIYQVSEDDMEFAGRSLSLSDGVFNLPRNCRPSGACSSAACDAARSPKEDTGYYKHL